ncbi:MAG TPA: phosphate signaling complex protein PhoU [Thermoplasmata archaeon]|nr:phosphate signaling complex protein PhoU [Thermoplasmata archaeon]
MQGGPEHLGPRRSFPELREHVAAMADVAAQMVAEGVQALLANDAELARRVIERDPALDRLDIGLETETIRLIATHQPEGADLRLLSATLKMGNDLDRIGRLGYDLARNLSRVPEPFDPQLLDLVREMDAKSRVMVREAVDAFRENDAERAKRVLAADDEVDALQQRLQRQIFQGLTQGGSSPERLARTLLAARHLERVADNACKIAEKTVYAITGQRRSEYFPLYSRKEPPAPPTEGADP